MKLHHYLWAVAAACMLLPGCSNEDLSDHAAAPVFIPGNSEVDVPLNYADYYYLEALARYMQVKGLDYKSL